MKADKRIVIITIMLISQCALGFAETHSLIQVNNTKSCWLDNGNQIILSDDNNCLKVININGEVTSVTSLPTPVDTIVTIGENDGKTLSILAFNQNEYQVIRIDDAGGIDLTPIPSQHEMNGPVFLLEDRVYWRNRESVLCVFDVNQGTLHLVDELKIGGLYFATSGENLDYLAVSDKLTGQKHVLSFSKDKHVQWNTPIENTTRDDIISYITELNDKAILVAIADISKVNPKSRIVSIAHDGAIQWQTTVFSDSESVLVDKMRENKSHEIHIIGTNGQQICTSTLTRHGAIIDTQNYASRCPYAVFPWIEEAYYYFDDMSKTLVGLTN